MQRLFHRSKTTFQESSCFPSDLIVKMHVKKSLKGTSFRVYISQSNQTVCLPIVDTSVDCSRFYSSASFPNLLGQNRVLAFYWFHYLFDTLDLINFPLDYYAHLEESVCHIYFPRCEDSLKTLIIPCQETYQEMHKGCATSSVENEALTSTFFASYHNRYLFLQASYVWNSSQCYRYCHYRWP